MEFMRWEWLKIIHGQFSRLSSCCKKSKPEPEDLSAEERVPLNSQELPPHINSSDAPPTPQRSGRRDKLPFTRRNTTALSSPASNRKTSAAGTHRPGNIDFWIPEIHNVQPGQDEYFDIHKEPSSSSTSSLVSTPGSRRRNTMPSSVTYKAVTADLNMSDIKPDLYDSSWSLGRGLEHCASPLQEELGDLLYSFLPDGESEGNERVQLYIDCVVRLPALPSCTDLKVLIQNQTNSRQIETVESKVSNNTLSINKTITVSPGMKVAVTVVDSDCQDAMLAHGTTTISVDRQTTPQSHNHMSQKDNPLMCSLIRKSKIPNGGARLLIKAEYNPHKQNLYISLDRLEIKNLEKYLDKYVYVKTTMYYRYKKIKSIKTSAMLLQKSSRLIPINKQFSFAVAAASFDELILVFNLMERSLLRQDILLGREILGPFLETHDRRPTIWGLFAASAQPITYMCNL